MISNNIKKMKLFTGSVFQQQNKMISNGSIQSLIIWYRMPKQQIQSRQKSNHLHQP